MQVLADAYAKAPAASQGGPTPRILPAIIIGILIGVDVCIWSWVGGVTAICKDALFLGARKGRSRSGC
jgi:hypothetical protein